MANDALFIELNLRLASIVKYKSADSEIACV